MSLINAINKAFAQKQKKGWDIIYFAVDIHDTIVVANYKVNDIPKEFFPLAKQTLQMLTKRPDVKLILYTCSHPHEIKEYLAYFQEHQITFDFINENPEVKTDLNGYGNYDSKFYFNVLLDDKAGFDATCDWEKIYNNTYFNQGEILKEVIKLVDDETLFSARGLLEKLIESAKATAEFFRKSGFETTALTSEAMAAAYTNMLGLLNKIDPKPEIDPTDNELGMVDWRETQ